MRRRVIRGTGPDGEPVEIIRLEPENEEDVREILRLERAGLVDTDENPADEAETKRQRSLKRSR